MKQRIGNRLLAMTLCLCLLMNMFGVDVAVALGEAGIATISDEQQGEAVPGTEQGSTVSEESGKSEQTEASGGISDIPEMPKAPETPANSETDKDKMPQTPEQTGPAVPDESDKSDESVTPEQPEPKETEVPEKPNELPDSAPEQTEVPSGELPTETPEPEETETPAPTPTQTPVPEAEEIFGDVNGDGSVNLDDLLDLLRSGVSLREARNLMPLTILSNQLVEDDAFEAELWSDKDGTHVQNLSHSALMGRAGRWDGLRTGKLCESELRYRESDYPALEGYAFAGVTYEEDYVTELSMLAITDVSGSVQTALYMTTVDKYGVEGFAVLPEWEKLVLRYVEAAQRPDDNDADQSDEGDGERSDDEDAAVQPVPPMLPGIGLPLIPVPGWVPSEATPGEATPGEATPEEDEFDLDAWIEEQLRALENQYNSDIMPLSFVEGFIPWKDYFTVNGLPGKITEEKWFTDCKTVSERGYNVDNTGVKYTKFPQYDGIHFDSVTVNGVEVVRAGILMPDTGSGEPLYYYMTQKHVDSDSSDGSGSHTGSISALLLPKDAKFQVNYAVNEYKLSYAVTLDKRDVTKEIVQGTELTWERTIFAGQNPPSTNNGAASFSVTIPYGYTATVWMKGDGDEKATELTGKRTELPEDQRAEKIVNEGHPLGMEPTYTYDKKGVYVAKDSPSVKRMSAVFYSDLITKNISIEVRLVKDTSDPVFDAHYWLATENAKGRGSTGKGFNRTEKDGNIDTEDTWNWDDGVFAQEDPAELLKNKDATYASHWYQEEEDGPWSLNWIFQTNKPETNFVLDALELNGVYIDIPFRPKYIWEGGKGGKDVENPEKAGISVTTATLPDGAKVTLTNYREFNGGKQRVYVLQITGARSNVTVTGGNLMMYDGGAPEYVAMGLSGVTTDDNNSDNFGFYGTDGQWGTQPKVLIQVQSADNGVYTNFEGDPKNKYANLRFRLQSGYENPFYVWEDRANSALLESSQGQGIIAWSKAPEKLEPGYIYGPHADDNGVEWYYIRVGTAPSKGAGGHKMCLLTLVASARKFMVRYMVGGQDDTETNAPSEENENVQNMPSFDTDNDTWDDNLQVPGGLTGKHLERYDDNNGNFYDRQNSPIISVSDKVPTTKDGTKFFQHWVLVDEDENVIKVNGKPIIVRPNETIDLSAVSKYGVALGPDIGGVETNYYVLRLKGVWSDTPTNFQFYIRMMWVDEETGKSHVMDLVQNVTTSSTDENLTDDCLIVTVNTVTDTFKNWFKLHPFYAYAARNFIPTQDRKNDQILVDGKIWEKYPEEFTEGSAEQGIPNPDAHYRVETGKDGVTRYFVQREGTIILHLEQINGRLPVTKTVFGAGAAPSAFTYTIRGELLQSDIDRSKQEPGSPGYLTEESLKNLLPSGTFFGMAPDANMTELRGFTGAVVDLHFTRHAEGDDLTKWYSEATFTLKGGEATVLGIPQAKYTIVEKDAPDGKNAFAYNVFVNGAHAPNRTAVKEVRVGNVEKAVNFVNEVRPVAKWPGLTTTITGADGADIPNATFDYTLNLTSGYGPGVSIESASDTITTANGMGIDRTPFGEVNFTHVGTYEFLVTETLRNADNVITPSNQSKAVTVVVENVNGQLTVTKIIVDGAVYTGSNVATAQVSFTHTYTPIPPDAVRVIPQVKKILHGRALLPSVFEFELTQMWDQKTATATNNAAANGGAGTVLFGPIDFKAAGTYTVKVREKTEDKPGIVYDNGEITITYEVKKDAAGVLQVTTTYSGGKGSDGDTFENQAYVDAGFDVVKNYDLSKRPGVDWEGDTFEITATLTGAPAGQRLVKHGDDYLDKGQKATLELTKTNQSGSFNFRFFNEGTYTFEVRETEGGLPGVSYDSSVYYVTVNVTANGQVLTSAVSIAKGGKAVAGNKVTFDNKFDPDHVDVTVNAKKVFQYANGQLASLTADDFRFDLTRNGNTMTASNDADGNVTFTLNMLSVGTYIYTLSERDEKRVGIEYDKNTYEVTVKVEKKPSDTAVTATVTYGTTDGLPPVFQNTLTKYGSLAVSNTVTGDSADLTKDFTYTFVFKDASGELKGAYPYVLEVGESEDGTDGQTGARSMSGKALKGNISSGESITLRHGQSVTIDALPSGTTYTVKESDYAGYTVTYDGIGGDTATGFINESETVNYQNTIASGVTPGESPRPSFAVEKTVTSEPENGRAYVPGETITYTIKVTNDGDVTLTDVTVIDELTGDTWTIEQIKPGEVVRLLTAYVVTSEDALKGSVENVATVTGVGLTPNVPDVSGDSGRVICVVEEPARDVRRGVGSVIRNASECFD